MSEQRYLTSGQLIPPLRLFDFSTIVETSDIRNAPFVTATRFRTNSSDMPAVTDTRKPPITRRPIMKKLTLLGIIGGAVPSRA